MLQWRVSRLPNPPQTVQTLTETLREEWIAIDQGSIGRLIRSMPERCWQCVQSRGGHTSYGAVFGPSSRIFNTFLTNLDNTKPIG